ncbi:Sodium/hydrogen exchanger family-domain-containing protein [Cerioporus squamosus]|nr:Sodium/hydrogen exchanger family-domain-containing protein [Cerioporus squamosus]
MVSLLVKEKLYINEVVLGTAIGVIFGPYCANIFNPRSWGGDINTITLEVMRVTLAAGLFAIGVELPQSYLWDHARGLLVMVVPTMAFGWLVVAAIVFVVFPPINFVSSLVIAACLTPTDPIISAAIVGGKYATKHVPLNLRRILSAESAANDGLAYPFLSISIYLTIERSRGVAFKEWILVGWLYEVVLGTIIGAVLGVGFSKLMKLSHRRGFIDRESYVAQYLALALFTIGVTRTLGVDDLLAAFACGSAISWDGFFNTQIEDEVFSSVIDLVLNCGCFVYIGAWMPFNMFNATDLSITPWRLVIVFVAVMFLRRIPPLLLLYKWVPEIGSWKEALFSGHFGPMGVGAIFVSTLAVTELPTPQSPPQDQAELLAATLQTIVSFVVLGSIIIHGLSIPFFSFGRNVRSRTVSLTRTWTSRNTNAPDWLLWARPTPADVTRPDTPTSVSRDVERGMEQVDPSGLTEPVVLSQEQASKKDQKDNHVPELGPVAMIGDATAKSLSSERPSTPQSASLRDNVNHVRSDRSPALHGIALTSTKQRVGPGEMADVEVKPDAAGNVADAAHSEVQVPSGTASPTRVATANASCVRVAPASEGDDLAERTQPPSGAQTPSSPRSVRFPVGDELATYFARAHRRERTSSGAQTPGSAGKAVRFPEDVFGSDGRRERADGSTAAVHSGDAVGGGAMVPGSQGQPQMLGKDSHFPSAQ